MTFVFTHLRALRKQLLAAHHLEGINVNDVRHDDAHQ